MRRMFRIFGVLALMAIFATAAYAFTAQNTVAGSNAGIGNGQIDGYDVTGVHYSLSGDRLAYVMFTVNPNNAHSVNVKFTGPGASGTSYISGSATAPCGAGPVGSQWTCKINEPATVTGVEITAAQ